MFKFNAASSKSGFLRSASRCALHVPASAANDSEHCPVIFFCGGIIFRHSADKERVAKLSRAALGFKTWRASSNHSIEWQVRWHANAFLSGPLLANGIGRLSNHNVKLSLN